MKPLSCIGMLSLLALIITASVVPATAETNARDVVALTTPVLAVGVAACLTSSDTKGQDRAARACDAVLMSVGLARAIKNSTGSGFPSGHTAATFAMAACLAQIHPKQKWLYYTAAAFMGYTSVRSRGHTFGEALGGAALGTSMGRLSMNSKDGLFLSKTFKF